LKIRTQHLGASQKKEGKRGIKKEDDGLIML
jgi:hypothetical protein